jgi:hypothetical protein
MSKDKIDKPGDSQGQLYLVGLLLLLAVMSKVWPKLAFLWEVHKFTIILSLWAGALSLLALGLGAVWNWYAKRSQENGITEKDSTSVLLGNDAGSGRPVHLKESFRTMHTQVIGTTNAGKTESVILPCALQDIENGSGVLIIDGKADAPFINKLYAYVKLYNREKDFRLFSLANPGPSSSFNPLKGDSPQEVTERVFSSFKFENEYYKNMQYKLFLSIVRLIFSLKETPTFSLVQRLLTDPAELTGWAQACPDELLKRDLLRFLKLPDRDREEKISGLETMLSHFTAGEMANLFEETEDSINFDEALAKNQIVYFQLPTMYFPFLAAATGKLVLQCFQNAVSKRQIYLGGEDSGESKVLFMHPR